MTEVTRRDLIGAATTGGVLLAAGTGTAATAAPPPARPAPLELWYRQPAAKWTEALPVGSGRLGAMVFGGVAQERLQLNVDTLWAGGPYDPVNPQAKAALPEVRALIAAGKYAEAQALAQERLMAKPLKQMPYQTAGSLLIDLPGGAPDGYRRALDLDAAVASVDCLRGGLRHRREVIATAVDGVIAVRLTADGKAAVAARVALAPEQPGGFAGDAAPGRIVWAGTNRPREGNEGKLRVAMGVQVVAEGGRITRDGDALVVADADAVTILVALETSWRGPADVSGDPIAVVAGLLDKAARRGWSTLRAAHVADHRRLFRRVSIDLGTSPAAADPTDVRIARSQTRDDPALAALYHQYGRYLLIACSRPGSQAANLQGLWNDSNSPPWGSKYTININTEMNYWPAEPAALQECVAPLVALVEGAAQTGARTARTMYGARGWVAHHNLDLWRATAPIDGAKFGLWPTGGAWLCRHLWDHYDYGRDRAFLARVWPLMRDAALFFVDTLQRDAASGWLVTSPSLSPENNHHPGVSLCAGPAMDMQILRDLFDQCVAASAILDVDRPLRTVFAATRARLAPDRIGRAGQLMEWMDDWDMGAVDLHHRHVSHLYGLYPSTQINADDTPALDAAARRSLEIRGDNATGWGIGWRINLWARLRDGDHAHGVLRLLLGPERTYPNMFDAHPPFQIDGNFGGAAGIVEMLVQSRGDLIDLLPALPSAWPAGRIAGIRTRGGCTLDLGWADGRLSHCTITAAEGGTRQVRTGGRIADVRLAKGRATTLRIGDFKAVATGGTGR